ncbi:MAG: ester cyclase [Janthinobacterium lividum]
MGPRPIRTPTRTSLTAVGPVSAYLGRCNAGALDRLDELVADPLVVNRLPTSRAACARQTAAVLAAFPDHRWAIRDLAVNRPLLAVHLVGTGPAPGPPGSGCPRPARR